jgi:hypothetical protein
MLVFLRLNICLRTEARPQRSKIETKVITKQVLVFCENLVVMTGAFAKC